MTEIQKCQAPCALRQSRQRPLPSTAQPPTALVPQLNHLPRTQPQNATAANCSRHSRSSMTPPQPRATLQRRHPLLPLPAMPGSTAGLQTPGATKTHLAASRISLQDSQAATSPSATATAQTPHLSQPARTQPQSSTASNASGHSRRRRRRNRGRPLEDGASHASVGGRHQHPLCQQQALLMLPLAPAPASHAASPQMHGAQRQLTAGDSMPGSPTAAAQPPPCRAQQRQSYVCITPQGPSLEPCPHHRCLGRGGTGRPLGCKRWQHRSSSFSCPRPCRRLGTADRQQLGPARRSSQPAPGPPSSTSSWSPFQTRLQQHCAADSSMHSFDPACSDQQAPKSRQQAGDAFAGPRRLVVQHLAAAVADRVAADQARAERRAEMAAARKAAEGAGAAIPAADGCVHPSASAAADTAARQPGRQASGSAGDPLQQAAAESAFSSFASGA